MYLCLLLWRPFSAPILLVYCTYGRVHNLTEKSAPVNRGEFMGQGDYKMSINTKRGGTDEKAAWKPVKMDIEGDLPIRLGRDTFEV